MTSRRCPAPLFLIILLLAGCKSTVGSKSPVRRVEQTVVNAVASQPTQAATFAATSTPLPSPDRIAYQSSELGIAFEYPRDWYLQEAPSEPVDLLLTSFDPAAPPHKLEWNDTTVSLGIRSAAGEPAAASLETWLRSKGQEAEAAHLEVFAEERLTLANGLPAARLTVFSGSGGIIDYVLVDLAGHPIEAVIEGNFALAQRVLDTLRTPAG